MANGALALSWVDAATKPRTFGVSVTASQWSPSFVAAADRRQSAVRFAFIPTPAWLTEILGTNSVLEIARVDRVDGQPFATATVWIQGDLSAGLSRLTLEQRPLSEQLGVNPGGATQVISAVAASKQDAELLQLPKGAPLVRCERTTVDTNGRPVLRSEALYNPLITEFVTELPPALEDADPAGLRLVPGRTRVEPELVGRSGSSA